MPDLADLSDLPNLAITEKLDCSFGYNTISTQINGSFRSLKDSMFRGTSEKKLHTKY